jgi:hypothetical protein
MKFVDPLCQGHIAVPSPCTINGSQNQCALNLVPPCSGNDLPDVARTLP